MWSIINLHHCFGVYEITRSIMSPLTARSIMNIKVKQPADIEQQCTGCTATVNEGASTSTAVSTFSTPEPDASDNQQISSQQATATPPSSLSTIEEPVSGECIVSNIYQQLNNLFLVYHLLHGGGHSILSQVFP